MDCKNAKECRAMKQENEAVRAALFDLCTDYANKHYDGHFTIMKFTTSWRCGFGIVDNWEGINKMSEGSTQSEAMLKLLKGVFVDG